MPAEVAAKPVQWKYEAISADGATKTKGTVEAITLDQAIGRIQRLGLIPLNVVDPTQASGLNKNLEIPGFKRYPSKKDFAVMARQLATMVGAGVSLIRALNIVTEQTHNQQLRDALRSCASLIESGSSFSDAMSQSGDIFPPIMIHMVSAGEAGGFLDDSLKTVADNFESDVRLQGQIKSAMAYPVIVLVIAFILVGVMLLTIVPSFASMYESMGAQLPPLTMVLVAMGKAAPIVIPLLLVAIFGFSIYWRQNRNKEYIRSWWEPFKLRVPVFGQLNTAVALSRFCRNFSSMLRSGVPILEALNIVGKTSGNYAIETASIRISADVEKGYRLADSMGREPVFPQMLVQMVSIGEDSGAIDQMVESAGKAYEDEVQSIAKQLTSLLEPIMICILGVVVGFMVVALYLPMFHMFDAMNSMAS